MVCMAMVVDYWGERTRVEGRGLEGVQGMVRVL